MTTANLAIAASLKDSRLWLLGIAAGLIAIQLTVNWRDGNINSWSTSVLFWFAICSVVWEKRQTLRLKAGIISSLLGTLLIAAVLLKSASHAGNFYYVAPFISATGLGLLASGVKGLKQYWQELLALFCLGVPQVSILSLADISELTAKFAAFVLSHLGFAVSRQGVYVALSTGAVEVNPACSGIRNIIQLFSIAVLFLVLFPINWKQKLFVPLVAVFLAFTVNGFRVAMLAILVAYSTPENFEYWHKGDGAQLFSLTSALLFGLFCYLMLRIDESKAQESAQS